ncbi:ankyrin repeat domain-containing protein [Nocardioides sp. NPDC047086]|uniref:ankyrin repeat domain-containing protein n=1 Tax=Nocardioides sp. NPDC047086 TaxID=3154810 RepID=UPI0033EEAB18
MDRAGRQELHYRALEGDVPGIEARLSAGDDVAAADQQGFTALHFAAQQSWAEAVRVLLAAGAPVNAQDRFGNTALWRAVFSSDGSVDTVACLVEAGADPDIVNGAGKTAREMATTLGKDQVVRLFADTR